MTSSSADPRRGSRPITVAVLTYQRPSFLPALLADLEREASSVAGRDRVRILVVDNDASGSARATVLEHSPAVRVDYVVEPRRGIAVARNRVLQECVADDLLVFIDDDERPDEGWLGSLLETYDRWSAAGVSGPVRTTYLGEPDPWAVAGGFVDRSHRDGLVTGDVVAEAATNNLLLDLSTVRRLGLTFQESVGLSSGEDAIFTRQLTAAGGRLVWCAEAWVTDLRPASRTTKRALLRRSYSFANAGVLVDLAMADTRAAAARVRLKACAGALARMGAGAASALVGSVTGSLTRQARGARLMARGCGAMAGCVGVRYEEYATATTMAPTTVEHQSAAPLRQPK